MADFQVKKHRAALLDAISMPSSIVLNRAHQQRFERFDEHMRGESYILILVLDERRLRLAELVASFTYACQEISKRCEIVVV